MRGIGSSEGCYSLISGGLDAGRKACVENVPQGRRQLTCIPIDFHPFCPRISSLGLPLSLLVSTMAIDRSSNYGRRLIPQILDELAATEPDRTVLSIAAFSESSHSFQRINAGAFAKAVDKTAWWLESLVGISAKIRPVGYIGPHDVRHILLTYACVKIGCAVSCGIVSSDLTDICCRLCFCHQRTMWKAL